MIQSWLKRLYAILFERRSRNATAPEDTAPQSAAPEADSLPARTSMDDRPPGVDARSSMSGEPEQPDEDQPKQAVVEPTPHGSVILPGASQESHPQSGDGHRNSQADTEPENSTRPSASDESVMPQEPHAALTSSTLTSGRRRYRRSYQLQLNLTQRPLFCCCCIGLGVEDARRLRRVLAFTRAVVRQWR